MDKLAIDVEYVDNVVVLKLRGIVDSGTAQFLEDTFNELVAASTVRIVADLGDVNYISSAGWGIFVGEIKGIRQRGGDIKLAAMPPDVREVFELLEFSTLLRPYGTREEAIAAFTAHQNTKTS
ncbi:MAG: anti-sigma factor antagonist [Candidatus Latescibacterota bacterium]|jgi:anti-sigma B factor antagonist|nr:MAG: anti-sigma factor antagonist [Candidatus Latescibacterota bacterium]